MLMNRNFTLDGPMDEDMQTYVRQPAPLMPNTGPIGRPRGPIAPFSRFGPSADVDPIREPYMPPRLPPVGPEMAVERPVPGRRMMPNPGKMQAMMMRRKAVRGGRRTPPVGGGFGVDRTADFE